jgi:hypothetical protein
LSNNTESPEPVIRAATRTPQIDNIVVVDSAAN